MKKNKKIILSLLVLSLILPGAVYAEGETDEILTTGQVENTETTITTYTGVTTLNGEVNYENANYTNETDNENVIVSNGGMVAIFNSNVTKKGNSSSYESNAAILNNNGSFSVDSSSVSTNGTYAPAFYVAISGEAFISGTKITTNGENSPAIMNLNGGKIIATDIEVNTTGKNSPAIYSYGSGRTLVVNGTYTTIGENSPVVYSSGDALVRNATIKSVSNEGIVIYGQGAATLEDTTANINGIHFYNSKEKNGEEIETSTFNSTNSNITVNNGDTVIIDADYAIVSLENTTVTNNNGKFLTVKANENGENKNSVTVFLNNEKIKGDIAIANGASLSLNIDKASVYEGSFGTSEQSGMVTLKLSKDSTFALTNDTYLTSLENEEESNSNIYANGHKLYVNGEEVSINQSKYVSKVEEKKDNSKGILYIAILAGFILTSAIGIAIFLKKVR